MKGVLHDGTATMAQPGIWVTCLGYVSLEQHLAASLEQPIERPVAKGQALVLNSCTNANPAGAGCLAFAASTIWLRRVFPTYPRLSA